MKCEKATSFGPICTQLFPFFFNGLMEQKNLFTLFMGHLSHSHFVQNHGAGFL